MSRVKANEVNIASRGGAGVVEDGLSQVKKNTTVKQAIKLSIEASKSPEKPGRKAKSQMVSINPSANAKVTTDIESLVTST